MCQTLVALCATYDSRVVSTAGQTCVVLVALQSGPRSRDGTSERIINYDESLIEDELFWDLRLHPLRLL